MKRSSFFNPGLASMALLLALVIWVVAMWEQNPILRDTLPYGIPIEVVNEEENLAYFGEIPQAVTLQVSAPQNLWDTITQESFRAYVNLQGLGPGLHRVPVRVQASNRAVQIVSQSPEVVDLILDQRLEKSVEIKVELLGEVAIGYEYGSPTVTPTLAVVTGPRSLLAKTVEAVAVVPLEGEKSAVERSFPLVARDELDQDISSVEISPPNATVTVPIGQRLGYKELSIRADPVGIAAPGYWTSLTVTPSTVTVYGSPDVIAQMPGFLDTEPIDIGGATRSIQRRVGLDVPSGVDVLGIQSVLVDIEVTPISAGQTIQVRPSVQGLAQGLSVKISPQAVQITLSGPMPDLIALEPGDVQVILDLSGRQSGTYKLSPQIIKPDTLEVESVVPDPLEVVITGQ